jgi:hypothetical protein
LRRESAKLQRQKIAAEVEKLSALNTMKALEKHGPVLRLSFGGLAPDKKET